MPSGTGRPDGPVTAWIAQVDLPLRLTGLPEGLTPWASLGWGRVTGLAGIEARFDRAWPLEWEVVSGTQVRQLMKIDPVFLDWIKLDRIRDVPLRMHTSISLTLVRNRHTTALSQTTTTVVPGIGLCNPVLSCWSAFRMPRVLVADSWTGLQPEFTSLSPFPAEFGISPITPLYLGRDRVAAPKPITVITAEPVEDVRAEFDLENVRLAEFEVH
jgi:hypothetical protein